MNKKINKSSWVVAIIISITAVIISITAAVVSIYKIVNSTNESKSIEGFKKIEDTNELSVNEIEPQSVGIKVKISDLKYQYNDNEISLITLRDYVAINDEMKYFDPTNNEYFLVIDVNNDETVVSLVKDDSKTCVYNMKNQDKVKVIKYVYDTEIIIRKMSLYGQDEEYILMIYETDNTLDVYLESSYCSLPIYSQFFYN